jgi:hypothetical protein
MRDIHDRFDGALDEPVFAEMVRCAYDLHVTRPSTAPYDREDFLFEDFKIPTDYQPQDTRGELPHGGLKFTGSNKRQCPKDMFELTESKFGPQVKNVYASLKCEIGGTKKLYDNDECITGVTKYFSDKYLAGEPLEPIKVDVTCAEVDKCGDTESRQFRLNPPIPGCSALSSSRGTINLNFPNGGWNGCGNGACTNTGSSNCDAFRPLRTFQLSAVWMTPVWKKWQRNLKLVLNWHLDKHPLGKCAPFLER